MVVVEPASVEAVGAEVIAEPWGMLAAMVITLASRRHPLALLAGLALMLACPAEEEETSTSEAGSSGTETSGGSGSDTSPSGTGPSETSGSGDSATSTSTDTTSSATDTTTATTTTATEGSSDTTSAVGLCDGGQPIGGLDSSIGIRFGDLPKLGGGTSGTSGGGGLPDDNVLLRLSNHPITCEDPYGDGNCEPFMKWQLSFNFPVGLQQPGVYSFEELNASWGVQDAGVGMKCGGTGGGGGETGTVIIDEWGDSIVGCIEADETIFGVDPTGTFTADGCGL